MTIQAVAKRLAAKYNTANPQTILEAMHIKIFEIPMTGIRGMYKRIKRNVVVFVDSELSEEDRLTANRARRVQRFLSQPFSVAEQFTGVPGVMVSIEDTIRGFKMIMDGETDDIPEQAFLNVGTIEDVFEKAKRLKEQLN